MLKKATPLEKCNPKPFWNPRTPQIVVCVQCQSSYHVSLTPKKAGQNFMVERQRCSYLLYIFYIPDRCLDHRNFVILSASKILLVESGHQPNFRCACLSCLDRCGLQSRRTSSTKESNISILIVLHGHANVWLMAAEDPDSKNALTCKVLFSQNNRILKNLDPVFPQDILTVQNTKGEDQVSIITIIYFLKHRHSPQN